MLTPSVSTPTTTASAPVRATRGVYGASIAAKTCRAYPLHPTSTPLGLAPSTLDFAPSSIALAPPSIRPRTFEHPSSHPRASPSHLRASVLAPSRLEAR